MNSINKEKRDFLRTKVKRLTSIVKHEGVYLLIEEDKTSTPITINVTDISTGGLRIDSEHELMNGAFIDLTVPGIETLESAILRCKVMRSSFDDANHIYDIGLRFIPPNTAYLKKLIELLNAN